ncbi:MAG: radical SAM protein [Micrococcales bacterium 73-13]|nr:MAG: radical SAM protein [Micrococcales bacterium 73-13]
MRWNGQRLGAADDGALPGLERDRLAGLVRTVETPEFAGMRFHEVLTRTALNHVPGTSSRMPLAWTINPYRGCSHACSYCFARPTHRYLDLDIGEGFDRDIVVKVNVAEVLRRELARPTWAHEHVSLGTNTDPYQRAEGRYRLMPDIIDALADSGTPFSILTKGTLLRRDLPRLVRARAQVDVDVSLSIAVYDDALAAELEPGAPSPKARLDTVRAAADAGFAVQVFLMPVLPYLTDTREHLERAAASAKAAGAASAIYTALHLRPGVKELFMDWLARTRPELVPRYRVVYERGAYARKDYREWLGAKVRPILRAHGLA